MRCRFATGTDAEIVRQISVHTDEGLTGWVAHHRRPLVNARPVADLEAAGLADLHTTLQSALACPLIFDDRLLGTLSVYHTAEGFYGTITGGSWTISRSRWPPSSATRFGSSRSRKIR